MHRPPCDDRRLGPIQVNFLLHHPRKSFTSHWRSSITITLTDIESVARYYGDIAARRAGGLGDDEKLSCAMATVLCAVSGDPVPEALSLTRLEDRFDRLRKR